jgi:phosphate/sulfate permease
VGSRTLTLRQACFIAVFTEFIGAVALGSNTADTIKGKILNVALFNQNPSLLMLAMMCALIGSSTFIMLATRLGFPVSTTHSIVGAIMGVGIAAFGAEGVNWNYASGGFSQIVASWFISPAMAGLIGLIVFSFTEFAVLRRENSYKICRYAIPLYFAGTSCLISFYIIYKGAPGLGTSNYSSTKAGWISAVVAVAMMLFAFFVYVPFIMRRIDKEEADRESKQSEKEMKQMTITGANETPTEEFKEDQVRFHDIAPESPQVMLDEITISHSSQDLVSPSVPKYYALRFWKIISYGTSVDVVSAQSADLEELHNAAPKFDSKTERVYSFLQILTSCVASFAHGSNDVSNACGPLASVWDVYQNLDKYEQTQKINSKAEVPTWLLAFCAGLLVIGLVTYGYNIMSSLGNKLTYHSPSRGFSMELASATSVLTASKLGWPVSTTHCITGATFGVGLCARDLKAVNWSKMAIFFFAWVITVPCAGLVSGLIFSMMAYAPKAFDPYTTVVYVNVTQSS